MLQLTVARTATPGPDQTAMTVAGASVRAYDLANDDYLSMNTRSW